MPFNGLMPSPIDGGGGGAAVAATIRSSWSCPAMDRVAAVIFGILFIITAACLAFRSLASVVDSEPLRLRFVGDNFSADSSELRFEERFLSLLLLLWWCDDEDLLLLLPEEPFDLELLDDEEVDFLLGDVLLLPLFLPLVDLDVCFPAAVDEADDAAAPPAVSFPPLADDDEEGF